MITWIIQNLGTIIILILLTALVTGIISGMIKDKKHGRSSCGGNCAHCKMCTACKGENTKEKNKKQRIRRLF